MVESLIALVLVIVLVAMSLKIVKEEHRVIVVRLGRLVGIRGPGVIFVVPVTDRCIDIDLDQSVPGWRALGAGELESRVLTLYDSPDFWERRDS